MTLRCKVVFYACVLGLNICGSQASEVSESLSMIGYNLDSEVGQKRAFLTHHGEILSDINLSGWPPLQIESQQQCQVIVPEFFNEMARNDSLFSDFRATIQNFGKVGKKRLRADMAKLQKARASIYSGCLGLRTKDQLHSIDCAFGWKGREAVRIGKEEGIKDEKQIKMLLKIFKLLKKIDTLNSVGTDRAKDEELNYGAFRLLMLSEFAKFLRSRRDIPAEYSIRSYYGSKKREITLRETLGESLRPVPQFEWLDNAFGENGKDAMLLTAAYGIKNQFVAHFLLFLFKQLKLTYLIENLASA